MDAFEEDLYSKIERIDFALLVTDENNDPVGYATCYEENSRVCYMQAGGSFKKHRSMFYNLKAYKMMIDWILERYARITTRISNVNKSMLKMAIQCDFVISGMRLWNENLLLELHRSN